MSKILIDRSIVLDEKSGSLFYFDGTEININISKSVKAAVIVIYYAPARQLHCWAGEGIEIESEGIVSNPNPHNEPLHSRFVETTDDRRARASRKGSSNLSVRRS